MRTNFLRSAQSWTRLLLCLLAAAAGFAQSQPVKDEASEVVVLRAGVQRLALELLQHRAEFLQWKMQSMSSELTQVQAERHRLAAERQRIEREIGDLNQTSTNGPGGEDEDRREELKSIQLPALWESERAAATRETTLATALGAENARIIDIQKQLQRLAVEVPKRD